MEPAPLYKNIVYGSIQANGNVHIGDIIYQVERDFQSGSILFLRLEKTDDTHYLAHLSVKSRHSTQGTLSTSGAQWCENIEVNVPVQLLDELARFQAFRRKMDTRHRDVGLEEGERSTQVMEENLSRLLYHTFFSGETGKICAHFIGLLEEQRIEELLLAISTNEEEIINLPFEMVLPLLFPPKLGEAKKSLASNNFGLVRTKTTSLETFNMQGRHGTAAPLKMLFITALPENLDERGKMLQIEEEQTRLIKAIGALEATGDKQPKIAIEFLDNASLAELDKALRARQHDIVHISGHGAYHAAHHKGVLYFENEDGDEEQVTGAALGETLRGHACVKLLILSACETAISGSEGGVTEQVADFGVPGIVAMRFAVTDDGAKLFTTELYTQLAKGLPLTRALAYAREALHRDIEQHRAQAPQVRHYAEWFTPVVYQNQAVGALIDQAQPYRLPDHFYPQSSFLQTATSRLIGEGFIGRKRYLIGLRQAFQAGQHVCLHGLGGLGKTTLAEAFAHHYDNHSHTVIIFRNGHQINEAHILQTLNKRLAKARPDLAEQAQEVINDPQTDVLDKLRLLIANYLHGRKTILIFDNVEDVQTDEGGEVQRKIGSASLSTFLRHLCENAPADCHILFTTRYKIEDLSDVLRHITLDKMGYAEQYRLLNYSDILRRGIPMSDRDDVYRRLDGHPRGYEYLAALLQKDKNFRWQQVSQVETKVFENLLLEQVHARLTEREKALFQVVTVFIARTPLAALAAVSGESEVELLPVLRALQDWSLCYLEQDNRFEAHRLTREWMQQHITPPEKVKAWALQAGEYFKTQPTLDDAILAKDYFAIAEAWELFADTSFRIQDHFQLIGLYPQAFALNEAVLEKNISLNINADALNYNGVMLISVGQYDKAMDYLEQSLAIMQQIGDRQGEGATLNNISQIYNVKGDYDTALRYLEQALAIRQQIGDRKGEGTTLNNISQIYKVKGDYDTALLYLEQALAIRQQIGDRQGEGTTLNNLATTAHAKGDYDTALRYLEQALAIQQQIGDRKGEGTTLNNISQIYDAKGDYDTALRYLEQALAIMQQIGDIAGLATTLNNMGAIFLKQKNDLESATVAFWQSYSIFHRIGSPNARVPAEYLNSIVQRIGEAKFQEILSTIK